MSDFGVYIKQVREDKNMTLNQVAMYSEISAAQLSRIETGKRGVPKPPTIEKIAQALRVDYTELMKVAGYLEEMKLSDIEIFSHKLGKLRREKGRGLTETDIAERIGIPVEKYKKYEQEFGIPDKSLLIKIANVLDVSIDELLAPKTYYEIREEKHLKNERDIAKRLEAFKEDIENSDGLSFDGEPISDEAKESLIESMEHIFRQTQRINKKYIPKKHRDD